MSARRRRAVFLDRDGVLNRATVRDGKPYPPNSVSELEIPPDVPSALADLKRRGFLLLVVSNQPDVGRGTQSREQVEAINGKLGADLPLDDFFVCYHADSEGCDCRKPRPGLLARAAARYQLDLPSCYLVGDRWRDMDAGHDAGCVTIFLDYGYLERAPQREPGARVKSLRQAADWILQHAREQDSHPISQLKVKIFADGADKAAMLELYAQPYIRGFTTNPTLMRKLGIRDYEAFARDILEAIPDRPISLEVFADDFTEMERQGRRIASWGENVYVKIPVTNTKRESSVALVRRMAQAGVKLNVTAMMPLDQVRQVSQALADGPPACVSVFAGRIADTGRDPVPLMCAAVEILKPYPNIELIWASPRELLNIFQADAVGCHIITATHDILQKMSLVGKDLSEYSLDTVKMFYQDGLQSGFSL